MSDSDTASMIKQILQEHKVVIFSKTYCPYCTMAKDQFKNLQVEMFVMELDKRDDGDDIQTILGEMTGARSVPRCFVNGRFIGGGTDVKRMGEDGSLQKLLM